MLRSEKTTVAAVFFGFAIAEYFGVRELVRGLQPKPWNELQASIFLVGAAVLWYMPDRK